MNLFPKILFSILLLYFGVVLYANRAVYLSSFDEPYWKDKYEHSQWKLPLSKRIIGDDGLYLYEGYQLVHGGNPAELNAEVPPLGKYLIGISIALFGNGYIYGFVSTLTIVIFTVLLIKHLTRSMLLAVAGGLLVATDPLVTSQYTLTMLDSIQSACLLGGIFFLFQSKKNGRAHWLSGLFLGLFAETKFPLLLPIPFILCVFYLWITKKSTRYIGEFLLFFITAYVLAYIPYFLQGHSIIEWLQLQKYIASFYLHANLTPTWGSEVINLLIGRYQNIYSRDYLLSPVWSPTWTMLTLLFFFMGYAQIKRKHLEQCLLVTLGVSIVVAYLFVPFWTRYLVLVLPILYIVFLLSLQHIPPTSSLIVISGFVLVNILASSRVIFPTPENTVKQFTYDLSHMFYQDIFEAIPSQDKGGTSRNNFHHFGLQSMSDAQIENIDIKLFPTQFSAVKNPQSITLEVTYTTRSLGSFSETKTIPVIREQNRWMIPWNWSYLIEGLTSNRYLDTTVDFTKRGSIMGSDKKSIAEDVPSSLVWVTPGKVDPLQEESILKYFEMLVSQKVQAVAFHERLKGNSASDIALPFFVIPHTPLEEEEKKLLSFSGISFTPAYARINYGSAIVDVGTVENAFYGECCTWLYNTSLYEGKTGVEKNKNTVLKGINGGTIVLKNIDGSLARMVLQVEKKEGIDVQP